ncbi:MAG: NADH-quinone oxidoreductase subunit D [Candidatus Nanopelagicales bacterium]
MSHTPTDVPVADQPPVHQPGAVATGPLIETGHEHVFTVTGGDWDTIQIDPAHEDEHIVVNMGPQHPSTHGVLRLILEMEGETIQHATAGIGYLHTGIEKTCEYRTWVQGTTLVTRMDYLSSFFNEVGYCLAVEKLLGITDQVPERATVVRVILMELTRISSHLVCLATGGLELGALTAMIFGFREREYILDLFELISGLRMNHAYVRPGGLAQDLPAVDDKGEDIKKRIQWVIDTLRVRFRDTSNLLVDNKIWMGRTSGIGHLDLSGCVALGITGPVLRATGMPWDLRKMQPYCGYQEYEFDVVTANTADAYGRFLIRLGEMQQSLNIIEQALDKLQPGPVMVADKKIAWPSQLQIGSDGLGNSLDHIRNIMGTSMEALIHHFKLVTEGFRVPVGQAYVALESARGELGVHVVSAGGTKPYRVHYRDPSFNNLQSVAAMCEGGQVADVIAAVASIDPVLGGVDR